MKFCTYGVPGIHSGYAEERILDREYIPGRHFGWKENNVIIDQVDQDKDIMYSPRMEPERLQGEIVFREVRTSNNPGIKEYVGVALISIAIYGLAYYLTP